MSKVYFEFFVIGKLTMMMPTYYQAGMTTKSKILSSAQLAARKRGYDGFSYADLSDAVNIRKASIHHYFPKKEDLVETLITDYRQQMNSKLQSITANHSTASDQFGKFIAHYQTALSGGDTLCLCVSLTISRDKLSDAVQAQLIAFHSEVEKWLADVFKTAQSDKSVSDVGKPVDEAAALLALVEGAQLRARSSGDVKDFRKAVKHFRDRLKA